MNSSSDLDYDVTTVYNVDMDTRRWSNRLLNRPPSYDEERLQHIRSPTTVPIIRNPSQQGFVSPAGVPTRAEAASYNPTSQHDGRSQHGEEYSQPYVYRNAIPPSVEPHHHNRQGQHPAAAPPPMAQHNQIPIQEIRVQQGYQPPNPPRVIYPQQQQQADDQISLAHSSYS